MTKARNGRVVKPLSPTQRANAKKWGAFHVGKGEAPPAAPTTSWWVGLSREELAARVAENQARVAASKLGRAQDPTFTR